MVARLEQAGSPADSLSALFAEAIASTIVPPSTSLPSTLLESTGSFSGLLYLRGQGFSYVVVARIHPIQLTYDNNNAKYMFTLILLVSRLEMDSSDLFHSGVFRLLTQTMRHQSSFKPGRVSTIS